MRILMERRYERTSDTQMEGYGDKKQRRLLLFERGQALGT